MTSLFVTQTKNMARIGAAAIAPRGVRHGNTKLLRTAWGSMEDVYLSYRLPKQQFNSNHGPRIHLARPALSQNRLSQSLSPKLSWTLV